MSIKIRPYKIYSKSAKALARGLGVLRIRSENYRVKRRDLIVNWGSTQTFNGWTKPDQVLNKPYNVRLAANKLESFTRFNSLGVPCPRWTTNRELAMSWLVEGEKLVVRHIVDGHSGRGIQIVHPGEEVPHAPLYTLYSKKREEYRVHVFRGQVIDVTQKRSRVGSSEDASFNNLIRNHQNGWIFARSETAPPQAVLDASIDAVLSLGLDFGAVDVGHKDGNVCVFEVNSAPGLEGTTLTRYVEAVNRWANPPVYGTNRRTVYERFI